MADDPQRDRHLQILSERKKAYQLTFASTAAARAVVEDLQKFCRGTETCLVPGDHDCTYALLGRNEVWHRIRDHLDLTPDQLAERYPLKPAKER